MSKSNISKKQILTKMILDEFGIKVKIISKKGKPVVAKNLHNIFCSGSDSNGLLFFGISKEREIGVDVEFLKERSNSFIKNIASKDETKLFKRYKHASTIIWSLKESAQKSDIKIYDPKHYTISKKGNKFIIQRGVHIWDSEFYINDGYVFCTSLKR